MSIPESQRGPADVLYHMRVKRLLEQLYPGDSPTYCFQSRRSSDYLVEVRSSAVTPDGRVSRELLFWRVLTNHSAVSARVQFEEILEERLRRERRPWIPTWQSRKVSESFYQIVATYFDAQGQQWLVDQRFEERQAYRLEALGRCLEYMERFLRQQIQDQVGNSQPVRHRMANSGFPRMGWQAFRCLNCGREVQVQLPQPGYFRLESAVNDQIGEVCRP